MWAHEVLVSRYLGVARTYAWLKDRYYSHGSLESVFRYVASCENLQPKNNSPYRPVSFLQSLAVAKPFARVHTDYFGPFTPAHRRSKYILLAIGPFSKFIIAKAVPNATAQSAAQFSVNCVILVHGCLHEAYTDRGAHFTDHMLQEVLWILVVEHLFTSLYYAQAEAAAEKACKLSLIFWITVRQQTKELRFGNQFCTFCNERI